jgi:flagellar basal-body rod protein FlgG
VNKQGLNYFFNSDSSQKAAIAKAEVRQGHLEQSNVAQAGAAVRLVDVMRQFESLQKALSIGAEMSKEAIEEVARVTQ